MVEDEAVFSYRIEDMNPDLLKKMLKTIEFDYNEEKVIKEFEDLSKKTHTAGKHDKSITLDDVSWWRRYKLKKYAKKFNYNVD